MWDLSSLTRDQSCIPCIGRWILHHWITREVPKIIIFPNLFLGLKLSPVNAVSSIQHVLEQAQSLGCGGERWGAFRAVSKQ